MAFQKQAFSHAVGRKLGSTDGEKVRSSPKPGVSELEPLAQLRGKGSMRKQPTVIHLYCFIPHRMQQI